MYNADMNEWIATVSQRLDAFLASEGRVASRAKAQKMIEAGLVRVNGKKEKRSSTPVEAGDTVKVTGELPPELSQIEPRDLGLTILYEDEACMVLDKPAGVAVHPGAGMEPDEVTMLSGIAYLFKKRSLPFSEASVLVHRLDKETTGCLLIAKNEDAHRMLQKQFETRTVEKKYLALVAGVPEHESAKVDSPIGRSQHDRTKMSVRGVGRMREAQTTYRVLAEGNGVSLLECDLHTGRTHQVRVHLHAIGHPVLGDPSYSTPASIKTSSGISGLCLHAWKLSFESPATGKRQHTEAAIPSLITNQMKKAGIAWSA